jgi:hypothetical protein
MRKPIITGSNHTENKEIRSFQDAKIASLAGDKEGYTLYPNRSILTGGVHT